MFSKVMDKGTVSVFDSSGISKFWSFWDTVSR